MSMLCTLPQPARLAYAVRWSNPREKYPGNRQARSKAGLHNRYENRLIGCKISLPHSYRFLQERFLPRARCALSQAASGPTGGHAMPDSVRNSRHESAR